MNKDLQIIFIYLLGTIFFYPVLALILMYQVGYLKDKLPHNHAWTLLQIFISGPGLIVLGFLLYFKYKGFANRVFGTLFLIIALYWFYNMFNDFEQRSRLDRAVLTLYMLVPLIDKRK